MSILSSSSGKQEKVMREITAIAGGTISHIKTPFYTKDDLKELFLHASLYAGLPAANAAMHMAEEVFAELGISPEKIK